LIDAYGFAFWVAESGGLEGASKTARETETGEVKRNLAFGGPYKAFDKSLRRTITELLTCQVRLHFFFDGPGRVRFKDATTSKRFVQRHDQWSELRSWCIDGNLDERGGPGLPFPPLMMDQFRATLASLASTVPTLPGGLPQVEILQCDGEADIDLAVACAANSRAIVIGNDSDFLIFKNCRYATFAALTVFRSSGVSPVLFVTRIWEASVLTELLGFCDEDSDHDMGHRRMCDMAAMLGNDFTAHISTTAWDLSSSVTLEVRADSGAAAVNDDDNDNGESLGDKDGEQKPLLLKKTVENILKNPAKLSSWIASQDKSWHLKGRTAEAKAARPLPRGGIPRSPPSRAILISVPRRPSFPRGLYL